MKILMINSVCGIRSTGRICTDLADALEKEGHTVKIAYGREKVPEKYQKYAVRIGNDLDVYSHVLQNRMFDNMGFSSVRTTKKFLAWAEEYHPDMLWLHNLHGYYINIELLFEWIKKHPNMQVKWTLHDCWAFTGHCSYFTMANCDQWKTHCMNCLQSNRYPASYVDHCQSNFDRKKAAFCGVKNMVLITPSKWLADLVKESFFNEYPVEVHYNTVDTNVFKPTPSDFRERYELQNKKIVLGVASIWDERKGLNDFYKLSEMLDERFAIVLVGGLSKKQLKNLPHNIIAISRTNNIKQLAEIYTAADVFVNPSKEETFGLTTIEALSCGTVPIVYRGTACEEVVSIYGGIISDSLADTAKIIQTNYND